MEDAPVSLPSRFLLQTLGNNIRASADSHGHIPQVVVIKTKGLSHPRLVGLRLHPVEEVESRHPNVK